MDEQKKGIFNLLSPGQSFVVGVTGGFLVLCTIGFFILAGLLLRGRFNVGTGASASGNESLSGASSKAPKEFSACLDEGQQAAIVKQDAQLGASLGVRGTPATFVNGYLVSGALSFEMVKQVIDTVLAGQEPKFDFMKDEEGNLPGKVNMPEFENAIWRGNKNAKVALVEFADFECPYCSKFAGTMEQVLADYGDKIKYTFRHFPLSFHANAQKAAEAFECAKEQDKAWEMYDKLFGFSDAKTMSVENYKKAASELGLK